LENPEVKAYIYGNVGDGDVSGNDWSLNNKRVPATTLMSARARAIYNFLRSKGVPKEQLESRPGKIHKDNTYDLTIELKNNGKK
jgi:hypothetical protein